MNNELTEEQRDRLETEVSSIWYVGPAGGDPYLSWLELSNAFEYLSRAMAVIGDQQAFHDMLTLERICHTRRWAECAERNKSVAKELEKESLG